MNLLYSIVHVPETIYNPDGFVCGSVNGSYNQITLIQFQNCKLSQLYTFPIKKISSCIAIYIENSDIQHIDHKLFYQYSDVKYLYVTYNNTLPSSN